MRLDILLFIIFYYIESSFIGIGSFIIDIIAIKLSGKSIFSSLYIYDSEKTFINILQRLALVMLVPSYFILMTIYQKIFRKKVIIKNQRRYK